MAAYSVSCLQSAAVALLAAVSLSAAAQTYVVPEPHMQSDGRVNIRAQPTTQSRILLQLEESDEKLAFLGRQGNWYRIRRSRAGNDLYGYIHKSQGHLLHSYRVISSDGYANVREAYKSGVDRGEAPIAQLRTGTRVLVYSEQNMGNWLFITEPVVGFVHKSQLRRED